MSYKLKFCLWLIAALERRPMTLPEIQEQWLKASANLDGEPIMERTFHRHRAYIETHLGVQIDCSKRAGYRYSIGSNIAEGHSRMYNWLLAALRMAGLADYAKSRQIVMIDDAPPSSSLLDTIVEAIEKGMCLGFTYKSHFTPEPASRSIMPVFVRLFLGRWYVVGLDTLTRIPIMYAFERMADVRISDEKSTLTKEEKEEYSPENFFSHCFGIIRSQDEPIHIRLRAFWPQDAYLRDVPLHSSQREVERTDGYTDYEIYVRPTYDLKQELMRLRDKVAVIAPEAFRQDMIKVIKATLQGYETGKSNAIDE